MIGPFSSQQLNEWATLNPRHRKGASDIKIVNFEDLERLEWKETGH